MSKQERDSFQRILRERDALQEELSRTRSDQVNQRARLERLIAAQERLEQTLDRNRALLGSLVNPDRGLVVLTDDDGIVLHINDAGAERLRQRARDIIGQVVEYALPTWIGQPTRKQIKRVREAKTSVQYEVARRKRAYECLLLPIWTEEGAISHFALFAQDISARRTAQLALERSEAKYRELVENANSIIIRFDTAGRITFFNEYAETFFGYHEKDVLGKPMVGTIIPATDGQGSNPKTMIADIVEHPEAYAQNENENMRKDGSRVWVLWSNKPVFDDKGALKEVLCVGVDATERRALEQELMQRAATCERTNRELDAFTSTVAHDLRTPLSSIQGFADLLVSAEGEMLTGERFECVRRIASNARRMNRLIQDLLDYARADKGKLEMESVDLGHLARLSLYDLRQNEEERNVEVKIEPDLFVWGDPRPLQVVMRNLVSNAWKYTRNANPATIEIGKTAKRGRAYIYVKDNGIGFPPEEEEELFHSFKRLSNAKDFTGTGLGLATVRRLVRRHGGSIYAQGKPGKGATFYLYLPPKQKNAHDDGTNA